MIALLRGLVVARADDSAVIDVQGVGYHVFVTPPLARSLALGEEVTLHIHTNVREDAIQLFGFPAESERHIFLSLRKVKGIGPKLAMAVLGATTTEELVDAVGRGDVKRLTAIPGLGKKTAERILVELQGAFSEMAILRETGTGVPPVGAVDRHLADVASALANLGFKPQQIDKALDGLRDADAPFADFDAAFRKAMQLLR